MSFVRILGALLLLGPIQPGGVSGSRLTVIQQPSDFELTSQSDKRVRLADYKDKVLLVSFIFTTCNGTCPATTSRMLQVQQELKTRGLLKGHRVHFLSITLDPTRDTPEMLRGYMRLYAIDAAGWTFLTGQPKDVNKVVADWGMWVKPLPNEQLDHPSRIFLVDRQGRVREIYNLLFLRPDWVSADVELLLKEPTR